MPSPSRLVVLGHPVAHSLSPRFQNAALRAAGIPLKYSAFDVEPSAFESVVEQLKHERVAGNVTVPFKERMHDVCDVLTSLAERVGAVNTFWVDDAGQLIGDNTDVGGFEYSVLTLLGGPPRNLTVGVLGAGGAAAGVLAAVEEWSGCTAHVYNRTPERAAQLAKRFRSVAQPVDDVGVIAGSQLVVNATSLGLRDDSMPIDVDLLPRDTVVVDLVYRPGETAFVRAARARGLRAVDGLPMLCEQGALAFERWFGREADRAVMWRALTESSPVS
ncbi:MAG TPA: shikimate dehydrogenase [Gemmatimonadaceae bacterium]|jgi:shikimate dehydrogenase